MTADEQVRELSATIDRELEAALKRASDAGENLQRAHQECEAANAAVLETQRRREGLRRTFAEVLGLAVEDEPQEEPEVPEPANANVVVEKEPAKPLQLVKAVKATSKRDLSTLPQWEQVKHVMGDSTMTMDEIRDGLKARKLSIANLANVLSKSKHTRVDPRTGERVKQNVFTSSQRGVWSVAEPDTEDTEPGDEEEPLEVLSREQVQAEMLRNSSQRAIAARRQ